MDTASRGAIGRAVNSRLVLTGIACLTFVLSLATWAVANDPRKLELSEVDPPTAEPPPWLREYVDASPGVQARMEAGRSLGSEGRVVAPTELKFSRNAFRALSGVEAAEVAVQKFPELVNEPLDSTPTLADGERIVSYPTPNSARLELLGGKHAVVESLLPLVTTNVDGEQFPVDLSVRAGKDALTPTHPLVPVRIGMQLAEGVTLPGIGLSLMPVDDSGRALQGTGTIIGTVAHFANTQADTDTIVKPLLLGFQTHSILRSPASPERLHFQVEVESDEDPTLTQLEDGSVLVEGAGSPITLVPPPLARDAAGAPVPVSMAVDGNLIVLAIDHRSEDHLYPIDVDPTVADSGSFAESEGQHNWVYSTNAPSVFEGVWDKTFGKLTLDNGEYPYKTNAYAYGNYGAWFYLTQGSSRIYEVDANASGSTYSALAFIAIVGQNGESWIEEGKTWVPWEPPYGSADHQVCATEGCASSAGSSANASVFELSAIENNNSYVHASLNSASVKIAQDQGASVSFDTTSAEIEGKPNALYGGGKWVKASDQARIKFSASDPGIGLSYASLSSPDYGSWNGASSKSLSGCVGVQCDPTYSLGRPIGNMVDGTKKIKATASNAIIGGEATQYVKVDNSGPVVALSGLGPSYITGLGEAELTFEIADGVSKASSGVAAGKTSVTLDGEEILAAGGDGCSPGPCSIEREYSFIGREIGVGEHKLVVKAEDQVGNATTREVQFVVTGPDGPAVDLGPGQLNLQSGNFLLSSNDVSEATTGSAFVVTRTHESIAPAALESPFGPNWQFSFGTWRKGWMMPDASFVITDSKGRQVVFDKVSGKYKPPAGYGEWSVVEGEWGRLILTAPNGSRTTFAKEGGLAPDDLYLPTWLEGPDGFRMFLSWNYYLGGPKLGSVSAYDPDDRCWDPAGNLCRELKFQHDGETTASGNAPEDWGDYLGRLSHVTLRVWDPGAEKAHNVDIAEYAYDALGRLRAVWDPRISPSLKTIYGYDSAGRVTAVTPPGQQAWTMIYGRPPGQGQADWLLSVNRAGANADLGNGDLPENVESPRLSSGYPVTGITHRVLNGSWVNNPTSYGYQWSSCDAEGENCAVIAGASNQSYAPHEEDIGKRLRASVTAVNAGGAVVAETPLSKPVSKAAEATFTSSLGTSGTGPGQFQTAGDVGQTSSGDLWVLDVYNHRIQKLDPQGEQIDVITEGGEGKKLTPNGLFVDEQDYLWITDSSRHVVEQFDPDGDFVQRIGGGWGTDPGQLRHPQGIAVDPEGDIVLADQLNHRVQEFTPQGQPIRVIGEEGSGPGQLNYPSDVAVSPDGTIWVADSGGGGVELFDEDGEFLRAIGAPGSGEGAVEHPLAIALGPKGQLWVADDNRLKQFDQAGELIRSLGEPGSGEGQFAFRWPSSIISDSEGNLWVTDGNNDRVQRWAVPGEETAFHVESLGTSGTGPGQFQTAGDVGQTSSGDLWVLDVYNHRIQKLDPQGEQIDVITEGGEGKKLTPNGLFVDEQDNLWITDSSRHVVEQFDPDGDFVQRIGGGWGTDPGQLRHPQGIAIDPEGDIVLADQLNHRVQEFTPQGQPIRVIGEEGSGPGQLNYPSDVAVSPDGTIWVADSGGGGVELFDEDGEFLRAIGAPGSGEGAVEHPLAIALGPKGQLWVADDNRLKQFDQAGELIRSLGEPGSGEGQFAFRWPSSIISDPEGNLWVTDGNNDRVQRWAVSAPEHEIPLPPDPETAVWTAVYDVPISGPGAPEAMDAETILSWGQSEVPVSATAVFPPDEIPSRQPSSYKRATIYYLNESGQIVNTRAPGGRLSTEEHDALGTVTRSLTPESRARALEAGWESQALSEQLDTQFAYSEGGSMLHSVLGPKREVELENGEVVQARPKTRYFYDEGAPEEGGPYNLVTKQTEAALVGEAEHDVRTKTFAYSGQSGLGWELGQPTSETTDPGGLNLTRTTLYDAGSGNVIETRMPSSPGGGDAGATRTIYYTGSENEEAEECGGRPDWAGLVCQTRPAVQPETPGVPDLPTTTLTYNIYLQALVTSEVAGEASRTATIEYDDAGRPVNAAISSTSGVPLPDVQTLYDEETGLPTVQATETEAIVSEYDSLGRLISYTDGDENTSTFAYDVLGRLAQSFDGKGTQTFSYDATTGDLAKVEDSAVGTFTAEHDAGGKIVEMRYPNDLEARYDYDAGGTATGLRYVDTSECAEECIWFEDEVTPSIHGETSSQETTLADTAYSYDDAGRLLRAEETPNGEGCTTRIYAYDANTNRTSSTTRGPAEGGGCAEAGGQTQTTAFDEADRLLGGGVAYDDFGNVTALPGAYAGGKALSSTYYADDSAASLSQDGVTIEYMLDPVGREREAITTEGEAESELISHFSGDGDSPSWTEDGSGSWTRYVGGMSGLVAIQSSTEGIDLQVSDLSGNLVATMPGVEAEGLSFLGEATEYGEPQVATPATYSWLGSAQRPVELDSGVVNMGARTYVPDVGRFLQVDPIAGGSANAYAYVHGDPVSEADPSGEYTPGRVPGWLTEYMENPPGMPPPPPPPPVETELLEEEIFQILESGGGGGGDFSFLISFVPKGIRNILDTLRPDGPLAWHQCVPKSELSFKLKLFQKVFGWGCVPKIKVGPIRSENDITAAYLAGVVWCALVNANPTGGNPLSLSVSMSIAGKFCGQGDRGWAYTYY